MLENPFMDEIARIIGKEFNLCLVMSFCAHDLLDWKSIQTLKNETPRGH